MAPPPHRFRRVPPQRPGPVLRAVLLSLLATGFLGCAGPPPLEALRVSPRMTEKDVQVVTVDLDTPAEPRQYRDWAQEQLDAVGGEPPNERYPGVPIYEMNYRFRISRELVAEVIFRRSDGGTGPLIHDQTVVRAVPEWLLRSRGEGGR